MSFFNWFWGFRDCLFNLIRFKDAIDSILSCKEKADSPWCELFIEIPHISVLGTTIWLFIRSKELGDSLCDSF